MWCVCMCMCTHVPLCLSYKILVFYIRLISWVLESDFVDSYLSSATLRFVWPEISYLTPVTQFPPLSNGNDNQVLNIK